MDDDVLLNIHVVFWQWVPQDSTLAITNAVFSCDSQSVYACFEDGSVNVFSASAMSLKLRCRIHPTAYLPSNPRYAPYLNNRTESKQVEYNIRILSFRNCDLTVPGCFPSSLLLIHPKLTSSR